MKKTDLNYAAGLMDGEGSIMLTKITKGKHRAPNVAISSTTHELLEFMKELFGGHISNKKNYATHHKKSWVWQLSYNAAYNFCKIISPYLKEPEKKRRAELIVKLYKAVTPRNGKYTTQQLQERVLFEEEFFEGSQVLL